MENWKKELAHEALELAIEKGMYFSYSVHINAIYLNKYPDFKSTTYVYLDWSKKLIKEQFDQLKKDVETLTKEG